MQNWLNKHTIEDTMGMTAGIITHQKLDNVREFLTINTYKNSSALIKC